MIIANRIVSGFPYALLCLASLGTLSGVGCSSADSMRLAEDAVERFHMQFNSDAFAQSFDDASVPYRRSRTRQSHVDRLRKTKGWYGEVLKSRKLDGSVENTRGGRLVSLVYETQYSEGIATEYFVYQIQVLPSAAKLLAYEFE